MPKIHGQEGTRLYKIWDNMKQRCNNPKDRHYPNWGGRGIRVCREWMDFVPFYSWAMSHGYSDELTIDRRNNDGDYCPNNCRWATRTMQNRNMRTPITNTSGYKGVYRCSDTNKWFASIKVNGRLMYLGRFNDIEDAVQARKDGEIRYWEQEG